MGEQIEGQIELEDYLAELEKEHSESFEILNHIPTGSKNAVKRSSLCSIMNMCDRTMRFNLHYARMKIPIINLQNGKGYFIPDMNSEKDVKMLVRWVLQEESRIKESRLILDAAKKSLRNCGIDWRCCGGR